MLYFATQSWQISSSSLSKGGVVCSRLKSEEEICFYPYQTEVLMQRLRTFSLLLLIFTFAALETGQGAIRTQSLQIPAGTHISVRNNTPIDSSKAAAGQTFAAQVTNDVRDAHGAVVIPHGAKAQLVVRSASKGGKIKGAANLVLALHSISVRGQRYAVKTNAVREPGSKGIGANKRTGKYVGGGAAVGGIIGAIAGGGKGALIGGAAGAGAGGTAQVLTKDKSVKIPAERLMTFMLPAGDRVVK